MAALNIGDIVEVVLTWDTPLASVAQNVWHYEMVSGTGVDSDDLLDEIRINTAVAFDEIEDSIAVQFAGVLYDLRKWDFVNHRYDGIGSLAATNLIGLSTVDPEPHGVAALGRIVTEFARRQGRTFLPGIDQVKVLVGALTAAFEADFAAFLVIWSAGLSLVGGDFVWCTFNVEPASPVFETASRAIGTVVANSLPSYLSKRKPGVGL